MCNDEGERTDGSSKESPSSWDSETDGGSDKLDLVLHAISNRRSRHILYHLQEHEVSEIEDITLAVCQAEYDSSAIDNRRLKEMKTTLMHSDLPKLEDAGFIEYDQRSETVRYQTPSRLLETFLLICAKIET